MGGVVKAVGGLLGGGSSAPAAPDYVGAANQTAANNLAAAQSATAANRVNQYTPYGSLNYSQTGKDANGNPMWSATQSVNPALQPAVDNSLSNVSNQYASSFNGGNLPSYGIDPGQTYSDAIMQRLQPTQQHQSEMSDAQLANQGIAPGTEAYNNAKRLLGQTQNDQLTSAIVGGMNTGLQANQQQYGQNLTNYNNTLANALNIKSLATPNYVNPAQQSTTAGADTLGATNAQYTNQLSAYNAQQAQNANMTSGLFGLGAAGLMSPAGTFSGLGSGLSSLFGGAATGGAYGAMGGAAGLGGAMGTGLTSGAGATGLLALSDIRAKENIKQIGKLPNGLSVYSFEYKPEFKDIGGQGKFVGVMAQEAEKIIPDSVLTMKNGYKAVDYSLIY